MDVYWHILSFRSGRVVGSEGYSSDLPILGITAIRTPLHGRRAVGVEEHG